MILTSATFEVHVDDALNEQSLDRLHDSHADDMAGWLDMELDALRERFLTEFSAVPEWAGLTVKTDTD